MIESRHIEMLSTSSQACDKVGHDMVHRADKAGEPMPPVDFRLYQAALEEYGGVPKPDARKLVKTIRTNYGKATPDQKGIMSDVLFNAFTGMVEGSSVRGGILGDFDTQPREEVVLYRRNR